MKKSIIIFFIIVLYGCGPSLTKNAQRITLVNSLSSELVSDCKRIGSVTGYAQPGWGNDIGLDQALTDARNKAANIPNADTLAISSVIRQFSGGEVTGIVFNCSQKRVQLIKNISKTQETEDTPSDVFEKAKKCQEKNGVWVNNQCVIPIE